MSFAHLAVHTHYSLDDSIVRIDDLVATAKKRQISALAITDNTNFYGLIKFYVACRQESIKPIIGIDLGVVSQVDGEPDTTFTITLLATNNAGYAELCKLVSTIHDSKETFARTTKSQLANHAGDLIALLGPSSDIGKALSASRREKAADCAEWYQAIFGDRVYLTVSRTARHAEAEYESNVVKFAESQSLPLVATNDVRMLDAEDYEFLGARVGIAKARTQNDDSWRNDFSRDQHLRSASEMISVFDDLPDAIENANHIATRCNVTLELDQPQLPTLDLDGNSAADALRDVVSKQLTEYLADHLGELAEPDEVYWQRLEYELETIIDMGFADYFLIVRKIIDWAKQQEIPVGPGRGSGAGSLVSYMLKITDLDPIRYELLFERLLNRERVSLPDFDIDICQDDRDRVIQYVFEEFGADHTALIVTFNTLAARQAIQDVARYMSIPLVEARRLTTLVSAKPGTTIEDAMVDSPELMQLINSDDRFPQVIETAKALEGLARNVGVHAAGLVISPNHLYDIVPYFRTSVGAVRTTMLDKVDVERAGLVKFDFLGLRTLTVIDLAVKAVNSESSGDERKLNIRHIDLEDEATFSDLKSGEVTGVFQLESTGMRELIHKMQPDRLEDIGVLVALYRPGPLESGVIDEYTNRKRGSAPVQFDHPLLETTLERTYGCMVYQEDVMQVSRDLADFTLGGADEFRRAMGKKDVVKMELLSNQFYEGAEQKGVTRQTAGLIFEKMAKFAGYAFNRAHAIAYGLISYQTAWLKTHHPAEFIGALLATESKRESVEGLFQELRRLRISLIRPSINNSPVRFTGSSKGVHFGLSGIKSIGRKFAGAVVAIRQQGAFADFTDFCTRIGQLNPNAHQLKNLIYAGALDEFGPSELDKYATRSWLLANVDFGREIASNARNESSGAGLFGDELKDEPKAFAKDDLVSSSELDELEQAVLGVAFTDNVDEIYARELATISQCRFGELQPTQRNKPVRLVGKVVDFRRRSFGENKVFLSVDLEQAGVKESVAFFDKWEDLEGQLTVGETVVIDANIKNGTGGRLRISAKKLMPIDIARKKLDAALRIRLPGKQCLEEIQQSVACGKSNGRGGSAVQVEVPTEHGSALIELGKAWRVNLSHDLLAQLVEMHGAQNIEIAYGEAITARS